MVRSVGRTRTFLPLLLCLLLASSALTAAPAAAVDTARISGQVTRAGDVGVAGVEVSVFRDSGSGQFDLLTWTQTDATGEYVVGGLPAGSYRLRFDAHANELAPEYFDDATALASATSVPVSAGGSVPDVDVVLGPAAHVTGHVTGDGLPLRFVQVEAYADADGDGTWDWIRGDETDVAGAYDVGGLAPGSYRLRFVDQPRNWVSEWYDDAASAGTAESVSLLAGQTVAGIDAALARASHITGTVTATLVNPGLPLPGIDVSAYAWSGGSWEWVWGDTTDGLGHYDLSGLDPGDYRVGFRDPQRSYAPGFYGGAPEVGSSDPVTVGVSAIVSGIDAQLAPGSGITGRVTAPSGAGLPDVGITVYRWETTGFARFDSFTTDSAGYYEAKGLTSGAYRLELYAWNWEVGEYWNDKANLADATTISLLATQVVHQVDAVLDPAQGPYAVKNQAPPVIAGTPRVGQTVTASSGLWSPSDVTVTYQWRAGGVSIPGATGQAYNPTGAEVGKTLQVRVTASRPGYWTGFAESLPTGAVAPLEPTSPVAKVVANSTLPKIKGVLRVGQTVKVTAGTWKPKSVTLKYQWFAGKAKIRKATKRTLVIGSKLVGKKLSVRVKATAPGYEPLTIRTKRTAEVRR